MPFVLKTMLPGSAIVHIICVRCLVYLVLLESMLKITIKKQRSILLGVIAAVSSAVIVTAVYDMSMQVQHSCHSIACLTAASC